MSRRQASQLALSPPVCIIPLSEYFDESVWLYLWGSLFLRPKSLRLRHSMRKGGKEGTKRSKGDTNKKEQWARDGVTLPSITASNPKTSLPSISYHLPISTLLLLVLSSSFFPSMLLFSSRFWSFSFAVTEITSLRYPRGALPPIPSSILGGVWEEGGGSTRIWRKTKET